MRKVRCLDTLFWRENKAKNDTCDILARYKHDSLPVASAPLRSPHAEKTRAVSFLNKIFSWMTGVVVGPIRRAEKGSGMGTFATDGKLNGLWH